MDKIILTKINRAKKELEEVADILEVTELKEAEKLIVAAFNNLNNLRLGQDTTAPARDDTGSNYTPPPTDAAPSDEVVN